MKRVVVIDDDQPSRRHLITILNSSGYDIAGAGASGKAAVTLARAAAPDVILMAIELADVDGIEASHEVMRSHPVPIVLITSHSDTATVERAKHAGVMAYLIKPLRAEQLSPAIELAIIRFQDFVALRAENSNLKETLEARKVIERAKGLIMQQRHLTEDQAYTLIKKASMNMRKPMAEIAQAIILAGGYLKGDKN
jgi:AmiR/NasT family two-component response regulator